MISALPYGAAVRAWFSAGTATVFAADVDAADVARAREGDESAFAALVGRHEGEIYRTCLRLLRDPDDALDATQETFLRAYRGLARFRGEAKFRTWLFGIALNACRNRLTSAHSRARRRMGSLQGALDDNGESIELPLPDPAPGPEANAYSSELRRALQGALAAIAAEHREVLVLREIEGLEYAELAGVLGIAEGTVKSRLARARAALRAALEEVWP